MTSRYAACLGVVLGAAAVAAGDDDLVARVREGHRAARESIRTLTASITEEMLHPNQKVLARGKYWRSGDVARAQEGEEGSQTTDFLMKGGEIRQVGRTWTRGQPVKATASRRPGNDLFCTCNAWWHMMLEFTGPDDWQLSLDRSLETADGPVRADRDTLDGRACIRLRFTHTYPGGRKENITQWHDVGYNYLVRKVVSETPSSPPYRGVSQVTDFIEPEPGVVFPVRVRRESYSGGELFQDRVSTLTNVVINKPIPAAALALPALPTGTKLRDYITGRVGPADSSWKPIGPTTPLPPPVVKAAPAPAALTGAAPSTSEPASTARWVLIASVAVLLAAAGLAVGRRLRRSAQPAS